MDSVFDDSELLEGLRAADLTEYESKAYIALVIHGSLSGNDVHKLSGIPHGKTYFALESLKQKGFVNVIAGRPKLFKAVDPEVALKDILKKKAERAEAIYQHVPTMLSDMQRTGLKGEAITEKIQYITQESPSLFKRFYRSSKRYLNVIYTYEERHYDRLPIVDELLENGVQVRFVVTKITPKNLAWMEDDIKRGAEVRYYPVENLRVVVRDDEEVIIGLLNPKNPKDRLYLHAESEGLAKSMKIYFDYIWEKAKPMGEVVKELKKKPMSK